MSPRRIAMTLVEVVIALAIFLSLMVAVLSGFTSTQDYAALGEAQDELQTESLRILDEISLDLTASGWHLPVVSGTTAPLVGPTGVTVSYTVAADDRKILYYPYVQLQRTDTTTADLDAGLGERLAHTWRSPALAGPAPPPSDIAHWLPGEPADRTKVFGLSQRAAYEQSFFARSQEMIFLKATVSDWNHAADQPSMDPKGAPALRFPGSRADWNGQLTDVDAEEEKRKRLGILYPSGWNPVYTGTTITSFDNRNVYTAAGATIGTTATIPYGVVMESGYLLNDMSIEVNWRTMDGNGYTTDTQTHDKLLEYMYAVIPTRGGLGSLVRAHSQTMDAATIPAMPTVGDTISFDATAAKGMVVERILSDNVVRVTFDTWRTVDQVEEPPDIYAVRTLDVNMVRVRLYMARRIGNSDRILTRVAERVLTMRARNSEKDKDFDQSGSSAAILGRAPIGISF